ncbi:MAG: lipoprotein-releasing ABC transporter permease subunit [Betaproteobacteria bacterium]
MFKISSLPFECRLGWRYTRARRGSRKNTFISFISGVSMFGIALGVAALIIVLSVMNGFQKEVRDRMLSVVSHVEIMSSQDASLEDWQSLQADLAQNPDVLGSAPYVSEQALLVKGELMRGSLIRGIDPQQEYKVAEFATQLPDQMTSQLQKGRFGVILGEELAYAMNVQVGDAVVVLSPGGQFSPAGMLPRMKQLRVIGLFKSGHYEFDASLVLLHIEDAKALFRLSGPNGLRVKLHRPQQARNFSQELQSQLGSAYTVSDWTRQNKTWFAAVQVEKRMMFIILTLIVAVAAFNLVSTLVMTVTDKLADIAIMRTLGAKPASIMFIFMIQGSLVGVIGTFLGFVGGTLVALNIDVIVPFIENLLGAHFLPKDIYFISSMPSDPQTADIAPIVIISLCMSFLATLYPSWRASRVNPAEALRYE